MTDGLFGGAGCRMDQEFLAHIRRIADALEAIAEAVTPDDERLDADEQS